MKRKLLIAAAVLVFAFGVLEMFSPSTPSEPNGTQLAAETPASTPQDQQSGAQDPPTPPASPATEENLAPEIPAESPEQPDVQDAPQPDHVLAAQAAAEAIQTVSTAPLMHESVRPEALKATVVPASRQVLERGLAKAAPGMALFFGYSSVADARARAGYRVVPEMYKVLDFGGGNATIAIFSIEFFKTGDRPLDPQAEANREYGVHQIKIVMMRKAKGEWLYVSNRDPKPSEAPAPVSGLPFEAMERRFQPYLGGYVDL